MKLKMFSLNSISAEADTEGRQTSAMEGEKAIFLYR